MSHRRPTEPRGARRTGGAEVGLPASDDGHGVFLVLNRSSGRSVWRPDPTDYLKEHLPHARLRILAAGEDPADSVRDAFASHQPPAVLGVCGGDGTVAAVAHLARSFDVPLLVLPGGTFNHFARAAGLDSAEDSVRALRAGQGVRADVAELSLEGEDPITVLNAASLGVYPDFVAERERIERYLSRWLGGLVAAVRVLRAAQPIRVTVLGKSARVWSLFVGVNRNHPDTVAPMQRLRLDDGVLDVRMLHAVSRLHAIAALAFGRRSSAVLRALRLLPPKAAGSWVTTEVTVTTRTTAANPPRFAHDGEVLDDAVSRDAVLSSASGDADARRVVVTTVRILPGALLLYSPRAD
jgi:diacylglycerol kinase family enzyme